MREITVYETVINTHKVIVDDSVTDEKISQAEIRADDINTFIILLGDNVVQDLHDGWSTSISSIDVVDVEDTEIE